MLRNFILIASLATVAAGAGAQTNPVAPRDLVPNLTELTGRPESDLTQLVIRFSRDEESMNRRYDGSSPARRKRMRDFYTGWSQKLEALNFERLGKEGQVDHVLLSNYIKHEISLLDRGEVHRTETSGLVPFADRLLALHDLRRSLAAVDARTAARTVAAVAAEVDSLRAKYESSTAPKVDKTIANRAANNVDQLKTIMTRWFNYYDGYDPVFTWWLKDPNKRLDESLTKYAKTLREKVVGFKAGQAGGSANDGPIVGDPVGRKGLEQELAYEMVAYTPEELIAIAEREYAFSLSEMKKASREMGFGDNWKAAMEKVKNTYVDPGKQPELIRDLARQAEAFFDRHDWITIPQLAREDWRMEMMSPARQRIAPFFLGGESIIVSYPTSDMTEEEKMMSLRGNNPHFSHAVVFHELNPGHHLQSFMMERYNPHRAQFYTPFWIEGGALYWEMFLWDHGFHASPEDRIGALFWRMHRSARIIFSMNFHIGKMTPEQAVQFLVDTVNFERANAEGEVRRSFSGDYSPLYQIAYMIGGLQLRALHKELVDSGKMTERAFHDAVLQGGPMPIAMVRVRLANAPLTRAGPPPWKFASELPPPVPAPAR